LTVTSATAANGTVTINPDGSLSYTPNAGFVGEDSISYSIDDGQGGTANATVTVTVNEVVPPNIAPIANDDWGGPGLFGEYFSYAQNPAQGRPNLTSLPQIETYVNHAAGPN